MCEVQNINRRIWREVVNKIPTYNDDKIKVDIK
jgi:hypothetical protein